MLLSLSVILLLCTLPHTLMKDGQTDQHPYPPLPDTDSDPIQEDKTAKLKNTSRQLQKNDERQIRTPLSSDLVEMRTYVKLSTRVKEIRDDLCIVSSFLSN